VRSGTRNGGNESHQCYGDGKNSPPPRMTGVEPTLRFGTVGLAGIHESTLGTKVRLSSNPATRQVATTPSAYSS
jgi:hypothetical protein